MIEKVTHGSMGRRWYWETSMVARCTRREETTGISSRAYGLSALYQCLTLQGTSGVVFPRYKATFTDVLIVSFGRYHRHKLLEDCPSSVRSLYTPGKKVNAQISISGVCYHFGYVLNCWVESRSGNKRANPVCSVNILVTHNTGPCSSETCSTLLSSARHKSSLCSIKDVPFSLHAART